MAQPNKYFWDLQSLSREVKMIIGSFAPAGTGSPTAAKGDGWSAVRSEAGVFLVTFSHNYQDLIAGGASVQVVQASDIDLYAQLGTYDPSASTLGIRLKQAGADADLAANANNRVHFWALFKRSSATPLSTASVA